MDEKINKQNLSEDNPLPTEKTMVEGNASPDTPDLSLTRNENLNSLSLQDKPRKIGSGSVVSLLGQGGMARIFKIWCDKLEIFRVVKVLLPSINESCYQRFQTEARITAKLHHPNIVEIHSVDEWKGLPFIEMEYLDGADLKGQIKNSGRIPVSVCTAIGVLICRALDYAHNQDIQLYGKLYHGIIHRDLKPENIMITVTGQVKLMDFGIARPSESSLHTVDGNITGTLPYLSPEQMDGGEIDSRTDIYSFGAILYEMLTGEMLYPQQDITRLLQAKTRGEYRDIDDFNIKIPKALNKLIRRCLEPEITKRFPNAGELLVALENLHSALTDISPEKTVAAFITNPASFNKNVPPLNRKLPSRTLRLFLVSGASLILLLSGLLSLHFLRPGLPTADKKTETKDLKTDNRTQAQPLARTASFPVRPEPQQPVVVSTVSVPQPKPPVVLRPETPSGTGSLASEPKTPSVSDHKNHSRTPTVQTVENALADGNFQDAAQDLAALKIHDKKVIALAVRALLSANKVLPPGKTMLLFRDVECEDGGYYLAIGRIALNAGNKSEAVSIFRKALETSSMITSPEELKRDGFYWLAKTYDAVYELKKDESSLRQARSAWRMVENLLADNPGHPYMIEAEKALSTAR